jgi:hypothetical protein
MPTNNTLPLHWSDYAELAAHAHSLNEKAPMLFAIQSWYHSAHDYAADKLSMRPSSGKLSEISSALRSRLEDWAIVPTCAYTRATRQINVRLTFATENVVDPAFVYRDDVQLAAHLSLQLNPAYDIITRYLQVASSTIMAVRALEMRPPVTSSDMQYTGVYLTHYPWSEKEQKHIRVGMPFAMSVFLTYDNFDF